MTKTTSSIRSRLLACDEESGGPLPTWTWKAYLLATCSHRVVQGIASEKLWLCGGDPDKESTSGINHPSARVLEDAYESFRYVKRNYTMYKNPATACQPRFLSSFLLRTTGQLLVSL